MPDELRQAALSAAQGISAKEAMDTFCEQIARQKPAWKIARELLALHYPTLQAMGPVCAAHAASLGKPVEELTQNEKKQAMLNWALREGEG